MEKINVRRKVFKPKMCDKYDDHAKKYFSTEEEFLLDRIRNYFTPLKTYFQIKEMSKKGEISADKDLKDLLGNLEEQCQISSEKISYFLDPKNKFD